MASTEHLISKQDKDMAVLRGLNARMNITLYTIPTCAACALTKAALTERDIAFIERSATEYAAGLIAKGFDGITPVVTFTVESELVVWQGHRPDLLDLLVDLVAHGPLPHHGFRDIADASDSVLSRFQVMQHIRGHQLASEDFFADHGNQPLYRGSVVLGWLGY